MFLILITFVYCIIGQSINYDQQSKLYQLMKLKDHLERNIHWLQRADFKMLNEGAADSTGQETAAVIASSAAGVATLGTT